ncbi:MAG: hypothetical protein CL843_12915 [Crocinitomicaceae bacterium]|nr:hypothetical protein [Crocinitomicaceae bacterium]|tara:strand:+ start:16994 stop:18184 length:1191 start_codon:yes stop_codon:yes gene_type:complete
MIIIKFIFAIVFAYLYFNTVYIAVFAFAGLFAKKKSGFQVLEQKKSFVIFMPCYKGDEVIKHTAREALKVNYPKDKFRIVVIADSLQPETIADLQTLDLQVVPVKFENSTKAKSLKAALKAVKEHYDYAMILDIDNIMEPAFLEKMNYHLRNNTRVLQAHRVALNTDTPFALLDAISEEINNHIFRKGHRVLGLSAAFIGSGKALEYNFYAAFIQEIDAIGGFDKEMELKLLKQKEYIEYADNALVYDEKVQEAGRFQNQRKRWLSAQFHYFSSHFFPATLALLKGNLDYFDKMIQMILFPRLLLIGSLFLLTALSFLLQLYPFIWLGTFLLALFSLLISMPRAYYSKRTLLAVLHIPKAFFLMFATLFKLKGANKKFIHTEHSHVQKNETDENRN